MANHAKAILIKGIMTLVVLYLVLGLGFGITFGNVFLMTLVLGVVSYIVGDLYILPKTSNMTATIADLGMASVLIWLIGLASADLSLGAMAGAAITAAIIIGVGEYLFHIYILKKDLGYNSRKYETASDM